MSKLKSTLILGAVSLIFMASAAQAAEKLLATIHRKSDKVKCKIILITDKNEDIVRVTFKIFEEDGTLDRNVNISPKELPEGKAVLTKKTIKVITLQSDNMALQNGGNINIRYLAQFKLFGKNLYGNFPILLDRIGDTWEVSKDGYVFKELMTFDHSKGITKFEVIN